MPSFIINLVVAGLLLAGQDGPGLARIAVSGDPPTIYRLMPADQGRTAIMAYGRDPSGEAIARWEINGAGRALEVTRDAGRACVIGVRTVNGKRRGDAGGAWTLTVIDLVSGRTTDPMALGVAPSAVTLLAPPGAEPKLLIATADRIAAYSLDPPRTSWFYTSPGENSAIAGGGAGLVAVLRGGKLAVIDPSKRPRVDGRLQLTNDDATSTIDLPSAGLAVAMSDDGAVAAVLHRDRLTVTLIDVVAGTVMGTRTLSGQTDSPVMRILGPAETGYRLVVASVSPLPSMAEIAIDAPPGPVVAQAPPAPEPQTPAAIPEPERQTPPTATKPQQPGAEPSATPAREPDAEPEESPSKEEPVEEQAPRAGPPAEETSKAAPEPEPDSGQVPEPVAPPSSEVKPAPPTPVAPTRATDEAFLSGIIKGEVTAAREARFYGPNNILKLHARAPVSGDGTFRIALPPPGSYRVVITGDPAAHLFTHPEFRTVVVGTDGKGISGIDFEVRGRL